MIKHCQDIGVNSVLFYCRSMLFECHMWWVPYKLKYALLTIYPKGILSFSPECQ